MLIMTTIDDLPPEGIPYITDKIISTGAKNVHILNALTKKGRMEYIILVDFDEEYLDNVSSLLALEFGTIGMKLFSYEHIKFPYKIIDKKVIVNVKGSSFESSVKIKYLYNLEDELISLKAEYEDLKILASKLGNESISFSKLKTIIEAEAYRNSIDDEILLEL